MAELRVNRIGERMMMAGSCCALVAGMAVVDKTMGGPLGGVFSSSGAAEISRTGAGLARTVRTFVDTAGYQSSEHGMLVVFAVGALVLFVLMIRT